MKILVTAFEPFNGATVNPSEMILGRLAAPDGVELIRELLPVEFVRTTELLRGLLSQHQPDAVLSLGQAGNRPEICVERVAINLACARSSDGTRLTADNAGYAPVDVPIFAGGQNAYFSTLPVWDMVEAIRGAGVAGAVSYTAGTYVCNHVMCTVLHEAACSWPGMRAGFVHVPFLPQQMEGRQSGYAMELEDMVRGVQAALVCLSKCNMQ